MGKNVSKTVQNLKISFVTKMYHRGFTVKIKQKKINFDHKNCDPRRSRIEKMLAQNCPKFRLIREYIRYSIIGPTMPGKGTL
jgi:hypothetical protein